MVKYNVNTNKPPNTSTCWKPKYVVVGGVISTNPCMLHMYRSKDEYDIAVMETVAKKSISVKVKSFSLLNASLVLDDISGSHIHTVTYDDKEWRYIVIIPEHPKKQKPIKIASTNDIGLKAVYDAVRRVISQSGEMENNTCVEQSSLASKFMMKFPLNRRRATM